MILNLIRLLSSFQTGGYFRFVDGWHLTLANWGSGEPSTDRPCVFVDVDLKWKTAHCNRNISSICMKSAGRAYYSRSHYYFAVITQP